MNGTHSTARGVIKAIDGDHALVEIEHGGCGRCHEEGGCGGQQLTQMFCGGQKTYRVANAIGATIGERVVIAIAGGSVKRTANLAYGVPLLSMIAGAALGASLGGDLGSMLGAAIGLLAAFFYIRIRSRGEAGNSVERPHIISRS